MMHAIIPSKVMKTSFLFFFVFLVVFVNENQEAFASIPTFNYKSFSLIDGGVQNSVGPTAPVVIQVIDPTVAGSGSVSVHVSSSTDPTGINLILYEETPGTFASAELVLMSSTNIVPRGGTLTVTIFDTLFTIPNPSEIQTLEGPPIVIVSDSDKNGFFPQFTETGPDTNLYEATINFDSSTNPATNTLKVSPGDVFTVFDLSPFGNSPNGIYDGNHGIKAEVDGMVTVSYLGDSNSFKIHPFPQPGRGSGGFVSPGLVVDSTSSGGQCGNCQPPTLGIDMNLKRIVSNGFSYNNNPIDVEQFYTPYPLVKVEVGKENTAILKIFDDGGVDAISHVGLAFGLGHGEIFSQSKAIISLDRTFDGKELTDVFDPEHVLDNVKILTSTDLCNNISSTKCLIVQIQHTFREELEFNMVSTNVWDNKRNGWQNYYNHGIEVRGDSLNPPKTKMVAFGEKEMHGLHELRLIDKINHLWIDIFGNIYEDRGNDRFDRIYSKPSGIVHDKLTQHGCDRKCNWFHEYKLNEESLAKSKLKEILEGKIIDGDPLKLPFTYELHPTTRSENSELQKSIIFEQIKAQKILENLR